MNLRKDHYRGALRSVPLCTRKWAGEAVVWDSVVCSAINTSRGRESFGWSFALAELWNETSLAWGLPGPPRRGGEGH